MYIPKVLLTLATWVEGYSTLFICVCVCVCVHTRVTTKLLFKLNYLKSEPAIAMKLCIEMEKLLLYKAG